MPNQNILREYLVKLGFATDLVGYSQFQSALRSSQDLATTNLSSIATSMVKWQTAITGGFAAVGAAAVGMVDKVAMADQEYRLLGLRMFTTKNIARELKISLDALGQPLENVAWDPELASRFAQLVKDQKELGAQLGPSFDKQMRSIRDIRFEFSRFGVELEYLTMFLAKDFAKIFGISTDDLLGKLKSINEWIITHMPEIASWIESNLKPVFADIKTVLGETVDLMALLGTTFTNVVGVVAGDKSLEGATFNFEKMATAIRDVIGWMRAFVQEMVHAEELFLHIVNAGAFIAGKDWAGAKSELKIIKNSVDPLSGGGLGSVLGNLLGGPLVSGLLAQSGTLLGMGNNRERDPAYIQRAIVETAKQFGVDPRLALAVAAKESGFRQYDDSGRVLTNFGTPGAPSHAAGIFQLQPGTANMMGVDASDASQNIFGGVKYLKYLLTKYRGDQQRALESYYGSSDKATNAGYARDVQGLQSSITIGSMTINVPKTNATPQDIQAAVTRGIRDAQNQKVQRNLAEFQAPGWSY